MKKILKWTLILVGVVVLLVGGFITYVAVAAPPSYEVKAVDIQIESTPERLAEGKKMALYTCVGCHVNSQTGQLTGKLLDEVPPEFGKLYSRNITNDKEYGIGNWTDGELAYLIRTGILKNGKLAAVMPAFPRLSDEDLKSVIAFLRSDDPMVQAAAVPDHDLEPSLMAKGLMHFVFKPMPWTDEVITAPANTDQIAYGKYLAIDKYDCYGCHSADFKTVNHLSPEHSPGFLGGGNKLISLNRKEIFSANITMDKETGIGNWTEEQFIQAVKFGKTPTGQLRFPMPPYTTLDDEEVRAMYAYLKSVPTLKNKVERLLN